MFVYNSPGKREDILKRDTSCYQTTKNNGPQRLRIPPDTEMGRGVLDRRRDLSARKTVHKRQTATKTARGSMMGKTMPKQDRLVL